jgi:hypothetical protein
MGIISEARNVGSNAMSRTTGALAGGRSSEEKPASQGTRQIDTEDRVDISSDDGAQAQVKGGKPGKFANNLVETEAKINKANEKVENHEERYEALTENGWEKDVEITDSGKRNVTYTKEDGDEEFQLELKPEIGLRRTGVAEGGSYSSNDTEIYNSRGKNNGAGYANEASQEGKERFEEQIQKDLNKSE